MAALVVALPRIIIDLLMFTLIHGAVSAEIGMICGAVARAGRFRRQSGVGDSVCVLVFANEYKELT